MEVLTIATANDQYQVLSSLLVSRQQRHRRRQFLVQGVRPVSEALRSGWPLEAALWRGGTRLSAWARGVIDSAPAGRGYELSGPLLDRLAEKEGSEVLLVAKTPEASLGSVVPGPGTVLCCLDRVQSPGNLGSVLRSADAFGVAAVLLLGHSADPYDPRAVRASTGSVFHVPAVPVAGPEELSAWLAGLPEQCRPRVVAGEESAPPLGPGDLRPPLLLVLGGEGSGLSRAAAALCEVRVGVPMTGSASSLNLASAASILLYEAFRRRFGA